MTIDSVEPGPNADLAFPHPRARWGVELCHN